MRIAVTGSRGLVGRALTEALVWEEHEVVRLVRRASSADDEVQWDPAGDKLDLEYENTTGGALTVDGIIHYQW